MMIFIAADVSPPTRFPDDEMKTPSAKFGIRYSCPIRVLNPMSFPCTRLPVALVSVPSFSMVTPFRVVAGDDVAGIQGCAADDISGRVLDEDAVADVGAGLRPADRADPAPARPTWVPISLLATTLPRADGPRMWTPLA